MKRKRLAMILAIILAFLFIAPLVLSAFMASASNQTDLEKLRKRSVELDKEQERISQELAEVSQNKELAIKQKEALDKQIEVAENEIENVTAIIVALEKEIAIRTQELEQAIIEWEAELELYKQRVRALEESGQASYIGILVRADDFQDLLGRAEIISDILDYDQEVIAKLIEIRDRIAQAKADLEKHRADQAEEKAKLESRKKELELKYQQQDEFVRTLEKEENAYRTALSEAQAQEDRLDSEIKSLIERIAQEKREAEQRETSKMETARQAAIRANAEKEAAEKAAAEAHAKVAAAKTAAEKAAAAKELEKAEARKAAAAENQKKAEKAEKEEAAKSSAKTSAGKTTSGKAGYSWPLPGYTGSSSSFGMRFHPVLKRNKLHTGTDVPAPKGTKIKASKPGKVIKAGYNTGYGNYVVIDHGDGTNTLYGHMSKLQCSAGDNVDRLETIGLVGSTGFSTGNHLHFEIIVNGKQVNPMNYF